MPDEPARRPPEDPASRLRSVLDDVVVRRAAGEVLPDEAVILAHRDLMPALAERLDLLARLEEARKRADAEPADADPPSSRAHLAGARSAPSPFASFPGCEVVREIYRGGQGVVYEAVQRSTGRHVAVKVMREGPFASRGDKARFEREIKVLAQLKHPNIVTVHDSGVAAGCHYFVMDYVEGQALDDYVRNVKTPKRRNAETEAAEDMDVPELLKLFVKICDAVHAAHLRGIIHRDLKPSNIRVNAEGEPHILDFGLAKVADDSSTMESVSTVTVTGQFVGSLQWAAPEQADGSAHHIDLRTDVYALGMILYYLLTGRFPYPVSGTMRQVLDHIIYTDPARPSTVGSLAGRVDDELETIVLKCLSKDRERRYQIAGDLAADVRRYLAGEAIDAKRDSTLYVLRKHLHRHRIPLIIAASFCLLLGLSSIVAWTLYVSANREAEHARNSEAATRQSKDEATERLWESYLAQAQAKRWSGRPGRRFDSLDAIAKAASIRPSMELRNEAIACMGLIDVRVLRTIATEATALVPAFSPQLDRYAVVDDHGGVSVRRISDNRELAHLPPPAPPGTFTAKTLVFSPDGRYHARNWVPRADESAGMVELIDVVRGAPTMQSPFRAAEGFAFSPDSRLFAVGRPDESLTIHETATGKEWKRLDAVGPSTRMAFSPDGKQLAVVMSEGHEVRVYTLESGEIVRTLEQPSAAWGCEWSPDGLRLAVGCVDNNVYLWNPATGERTGIFSGHTNLPILISFHPRADLLLTAAWDGTTRLWDVASGSELLNVPGGSRGFYGDGNVLVIPQAQVAGNVTTLYELDYAPEAYMLHGHGRRASDGVYFDTSLTGDGRVGVSARGSFEGNPRVGVSLWDLTARKEVAHLPIGDTRSVLFESGEQTFITSGARGLVRWPIRRESGLVHIGPPLPLYTERVTMFAREGGNGRLAAHITEKDGGNSVVIIDQGSPRGQRVLQGHRSVSAFSFSPGGEWVATGTWQGTGVWLWDARTGERVRELPVEFSSGVEFSPDGKWLVTCAAREICFWEVGSWECHHRIERIGWTDVSGSVAFTPDGKLIALSHTRGFIHLLEMGTFRELARLEMAVSRDCQGLSFSGSGDRLTFSAGDAVQVWDLRAIREQLAKLGLDWEMPPYPPLTEEELRERESPEPLRVEIDLGEFARGESTGS